MKKEDKIKFQIEFTEVTKKQVDEIMAFLCNSGNKIKFQVIKSNDQYLNDEIEIIEETNEDLEDVKYLSCVYFKDGNKVELSQVEIDIINKINELVGNQNKINKKLTKED